MHHVKINNLSKRIIDDIIQNKEFYKTVIHELENGATVLDMTNASWIGGKLVGEICMGGLGTKLASQLLKTKTLSMEKLAKQRL